MSPSKEEQLATLSPDLQAAYAAYRTAPSAETWTPLSQMYIGPLQVFDGVKSVDPAFPDPYPLAAADTAESNADFYQWPSLPSPDVVLNAMYTLSVQLDHE
jgi:hypothetical protein